MYTLLRVNPITDSKVAAAMVIGRILDDVSHDAAEDRRISLKINNTSRRLSLPVLLVLGILASVFHDRKLIQARVLLVAPVV